jgi:Uma2 family endonuclease
MAGGSRAHGSGRLPPPFHELPEPLPTNLRMTEEDFVVWCDHDTPAEWVDGLVVFKEPISPEHDTLQWWLRSLLQFYVEARDLGVVVGPQFVTRLVTPRKRSRREPDVMFIAKERLASLAPNHLEGPPDLALEVVSPESEVRDRRDKFREYRAAGVREYWIVDPLTKTVEAWLHDGTAYTRIGDRDGKRESAVVPGWYVRAGWLWAEPRPSVLAAVAELGVR